MESTNLLSVSEMPVVQGRVDFPSFRVKIKKWGKIAGFSLQGRTIYSQNCL